MKFLKIWGGIIALLNIVPIMGAFVALMVAFILTGDVPEWNSAGYTTAEIVTTIIRVELGITILSLFVVATGDFDA